MQVRSLGQEDPLEEEMAAHSSILAWEISWTEEPGKLQSVGLRESDTTQLGSTCTGLSSFNMCGKQAASRSRPLLLPAW